MSQHGSQPSDRSLDFIEPPVRKPLVLFKEAERSLRVRTVAAIAPLLPSQVALTMGDVSHRADEWLETWLETLAHLDLEGITDADLRSPRILMGLAFVGFGGLMTMFLALCLSILHPELSAVAQLHDHWHPYVWSVSLGVAGLTMIGREAMRPPGQE
ncbi:hypothetical protein [Myxacorys almedinensis]|uniref:Uncharacterized protein n=1 Tax=Myxacorys almedinensis A TaxID=2690445 RepID=A0A8J7Z3K0_9CYAN|nr:hypothetical protein [Myxacorys almedinensis]NDJ18655.1 hypothetical protein [Myxacorys almedinensis A]